MRRLLSLILMGCLSSVCAQTVYRCEDSQGRRIFSDQPCRHFGALALPSDSDPPAAESDSKVMEPDALIDTGPPAAALGCVGSDPEQLAQGLVSAVEQADLNAIAALYHWPMASQGTASRVFSTAEFLVRSAPVMVELAPPTADDSWLWEGLPPPDRSTAALPALQVLSADRSRELHRFELIRNAGCVWLLPR